MKFILDKKARDLAKRKDIREIFINPDLYSKETCCGLGTVDFDVSLKAIGEKDLYKDFNDGEIKIYVNPNIFSFIKDDLDIVISAFGPGPFKKLYIKNEINTIER